MLITAVKSKKNEYMKKIIFTFLGLGFLMANAQTTLPTSWSFANPTPTGAASPSPSGPESAGPKGWSTKLDITASGTTPFTYSSGQDGSAACKLDATGEYVKIWFTDKPGTLSYYIKGTAISPNPPFTGTFTVQQSADGATWSDLRVFTQANLTTTNFVNFIDTPAATSRYVRFYYTQKVSGSNISLDNVTLASAPATPVAKMNIKQGANDIVNGSTFVIGKAAATTFTVENKGTADTLFVSGINTNGNAVADYSIIGAPLAVPANSSATFTVNFSTSINGTRKASMTINSNDPDKAQFLVNLYGIGGDYASEPTAQASALTFSNVKAYTMNVSFSATAGSEKYLVLRKLGSAITAAPADGQTYQRGDLIGDAQVAMVGTDTSFKPSYVLANSAYYYAVFPFNGPVGFENYTSNSLANNVNSSGANAGNYYTGIDQTKSTFLTDLSAKINTHDTIFYSNYSSSLVNNWLAKDTTAGRKVVYCVYTHLPYVYSEPFVWASSTSNGILTREHTFAQSWMPSNIGNANWPNGSNAKELPEYNDQHHLFPADQLNANAVRSNASFGEVVTVQSTSPSGFGKLGTNANGIKVWEPKDEHKGDVARALFYMSTCYNGVDSKNWGMGIGAFSQDTAVLMKWHRQDPPSEHEIARHEYVYSIQKNRNPFIDHPEWANSINFVNMTWIPTSSVGIKDYNALSQVQVYPNPVQESQITVSGAPFGTHALLFDYSGKLIFKGEVDANNSIQSGKLSTGVYLLELNFNGAKSYHKVLSN